MGLFDAAPKKQTPKIIKREKVDDEILKEVKSFLSSAAKKTT